MSDRLVQFDYCAGYVAFAEFDIFETTLDEMGLA